MRTLACLLITASAGIAATPKTPTYSEHIAPILHRHCAGCHRAGEAGPMPLTSYKETRPWAKAIQQAVVTRRMPVWLADPAHGAFRNDRRLAQAEIDKISAWASAGAPEGDPRKTPQLPAFETGWSIGKPDVTIDIGTDFAVPASGEVPYKYFTVDPGFTEDKWIEAAEVRPDKRSVVHHVIVFLMDPKETQLVASGGNLLVGYAPGEQPMILQPGAAKLVRAGTKFRFQMHYTPNGQATSDRTYIGLRFAKGPVKERALTGRALNFAFRIPPGDPNHEVKSTWTLKQDVTLTSLMPHMHVRGKDFQYTIVYPDGRDQVILRVPRYDFNWQLGYELKEPMRLPAGTRIDCVAHFDNSPNNRANPDPGKEVRWGDQTWEEMMIGWFNYTVPAE